LSIIKSKDLGHENAVRALRTPAVASPILVSDRPSELDRLKDQVAALSQQLHGAQGQLEQVSELVEKARLEGRSAGIEEGLTQAERQEGARLSALSRGVDAAHDALRQHLADIDRNALLVARAALEQVLGPAAAPGALLPDLIRRQLDHIAAETLVSIEVSADDFADDGALAALAGQSGAPRTSLAASTALASGACQIKLTLGAIDAGLGQQWDALDGVLRALIQPEARA